jgi:hypothetical protein
MRPFHDGTRRQMPYRHAEVAFRIDLAFASIEISPAALARARSVTTGGERLATGGEAVETAMLVAVLNARERTQIEAKDEFLSR